jgi:preprotein translocase subunit YajC
VLPKIRKGTEDMFITPAYAQTGGASDPFTGLLIPMLVMILIFYFLVIRPQQQRAKQHRETVEKVRRGDTVITSGGFIGKVTKATDTSDEVEVELSDTMRVRVLKSTLMDVRGKGEPAKETT